MLRLLSMSKTLHPRQGDTFKELGREFGRVAAENARYAGFMLQASLDLSREMLCTLFGVPIFRELLKSRKKERK